MTNQLIIFAYEENINHSVCFVTLIALFASCSTTEDEVSTTRTRKQSNSFSDSETTIPLDRALKSLDDFIKKNYPITKGTSFLRLNLFPTTAQVVKGPSLQMNLLLTPISLTIRMIQDLRYLERSLICRM